MAYQEAKVNNSPMKVGLGNSMKGKEVVRQMGSRRGKRARNIDVSLAETAMTLGRVTEAITLAETVLRTEPDHLFALEILARAHWRMGNYDAVLSVLDRLTRINPYEPGYHALRGASLQCLGRLGEAYRAHLRAGDAPGSPEACVELVSWQSELVRELLASDPVFRIRYSRDPRAACAERGFVLDDGKVAETRWLTGEADRTSLYTRPS